MERSYTATEQLLDEKPGLADTVEQLIAIDEDGPWTFEDVECDSGTFGELVSRDFVQEMDDGYRLVDREGVERALAGEGLPDEATDDSGIEVGYQTYRMREGVRARLAGARNRVSAIEWELDHRRSFLLSVTVALAFLVVMRTVLYREVFRGEHIVLPGNDPYHYRHWVDQLLHRDVGLLDFGTVGETVGGDTFTFVLGWWATTIFEGSPDQSGFVIAWLPVVLTVGVGILTAWMALVVTEDERIAVTSVLALAVLPSHAQYSLLGFFDHHPIDVLWIAIMAAALVWLARDAERQSLGAHLNSARTWLVAGIFGVTTALAMLTWAGAPLILLGVALYAVLRAVSDVRSTASPLLAALPLIAGLLLASVIAPAFYLEFAWSERAVAFAPAIVLAGTIGVTGIAELVDRQVGDPRVALGGTVAVGIASIVGLQRLAPSIWDRYVDRFWDSLIGREGIAETRGLLDVSYLLDLGFLQQFGFLLFFLLPALAYVSWRCVHEHEPMWLVPVSFAWAYFALVCIQVRFANEMAPFASIFAAAGIFWALQWANVSRPLAPFGDRSRLRLQIRQSLRRPNRTVYVAFVLVIVLTIGIFFTVVSMGVLTIDTDEYEAASYIAAETEGNEEFVFSRWGRNRMYNYFAWGGGDNYGYAQENFLPFLQDDNPDGWYETLTTPDRGVDEVSYIVIDERQQADPLTTYNQLFVEYGSSFTYDTQLGPDTGQTAGTGHYRLVHKTTHDTQAVFELVPGATLVGEHEPDEQFAIETPVEVSHVEFTYTRIAQVDQNGTFELRLAYPGNYTLPDGETIEVSDEDVEAGDEIDVGLIDPEAAAETDEE